MDHITLPIGYLNLTASCLTACAMLIERGHNQEAIDTLTDIAKELRDVAQGAQA